MRGRLGKKARMSALKGTNLAETSSEDESASKTEK